MTFTNGKQELQETLEEWNGLFTRNGLKIKLGKTEVLHIGHQKEELDIELEGKTLTQGDSFRYLKLGECAETGRWRERYVEEHRLERKRGEQLKGVMADQRISKRLKGNSGKDT